MTWEPGISFIVLEGARPAEPAPTPAPSPTPHPTPRPSPRPEPSPTPGPTPEPSPAPSPTPVPWFMATAVPAEATPAQAVPAGRRNTTSPASRSGRPLAALPGSVQIAGAALPLPWHLIMAPNWSDILGLGELSGDPPGQLMGPRRQPTAPAAEPAPGEGVALPADAVPSPSRGR